MGILTLLFCLVIVFAVINTLQLVKGNVASDRMIDLVKSIGLFALVFGVLGQLIGLYSAFEAIEQVGEVSQAMLAGGLKVSSITTIYGVLIYLISYLIWFGLTSWNAKGN